MELELVNQDLFVKLAVFFAAFIAVGVIGAYLYHKWMG